MRWWIVMLLLVLVSCGGPPEGTAAVTITKYSFDPIVVYVEPGTNVTWTNKDNEPHTVTLLGQFDSGSLGRRHTFSRVFDEKGVYEYTDLFHQKERVGKVVVR